MSKKSSATKVKLTDVSSLFGNSEHIKDVDSTKEEIIDVSLSDLHEFVGHPFRVVDDEKMDETVESIKKYGVIVPGIVRPRIKGGYEIVSGHRRKHASELAGLKTMPVFVRNLTDDEATIVMVDSNLQREEILPSEKAKAYAMKYDALRHQGSSGDGDSLELMSDEAGESRSKIQRYIWISRLNDDFLELVDTKKLGMAQAVDISFLTSEEQNILYDLIWELSIYPSMIQAAEIKALSQSDKFDIMAIKAVLIGTIKPKKRNITIKADKINTFFSDEYTEDDITEIILRLLEKWKSGEE
ncbi:MAG: ParB/RepB/Spo0J family partition protein [Eubacterium sp.]|jgi:ParB family chromosome partitioning protein|nr:ParB/RepB/Spo0J family partition protein [Eubacterium sp.]